MNTTSQLEPVAAIFCEVYANKPALKDGNEIARFIGFKKSAISEPQVALFNLIAPVGLIPLMGTVTAEVLREHGYSAPSTEIAYKPMLVDGEIVYVPRDKQAVKATEQRADIYAHRTHDDCGEMMA